MFRNRIFIIARNTNYIFKNRDYTTSDENDINTELWTLGNVLIPILRECRDIELLSVYKVDFMLYVLYIFCDCVAFIFGKIGRNLSKHVIDKFDLKTDTANKNNNKYDDIDINANSDIANSAMHLIE